MSGVSFGSATIRSSISAKTVPYINSNLLYKPVPLGKAFLNQTSTLTPNPDLTGLIISLVISGFLSLRCEQQLRNYLERVKRLLVRVSLDEDVVKES